MSERIVDEVSRAWWAIDSAGLPAWSKVGDGAREEVRVHALRWLEAINQAGYEIVPREDGR